MFYLPKEDQKIAGRCQQALDEKGLGVEDLANANRCSLSTAAKYLDGSLRVPLTVLAEISELTGRHLDWLVAGQWVPNLRHDPEYQEKSELINQVNTKWAEVIAQEIKEGFNLLTAIIHAVDGYIQDSGVPMDSQKKGELILKLYQLFADTEDKQVDNQTVAALIQMTQ